MKKVLIYLFLFAAVCAAENEHDDQNDRLDDWNYDTWYDYELENLNEKTAEEVKNEHYEDIDIDKKAKEDHLDDKITMNNGEFNNDYQIEDNRSEPKEVADKIAESPVVADDVKLGEDEKDNSEIKEAAEFTSEEQLAKEGILLEKKNNADAPVEPFKVNDELSIKELNISNNTANSTLTKSDGNQVSDDLFDIGDVEAIPLPPVGELDQLQQETKAILDNDEGNDFADIQDVQHKDEISNIIEDSKNILTESNGDFEVNDDEINGFSEEAAKDLLSVPKDDINLDEDTVDKVSKDLHEDLNKLMEVWSKLSDDPVEKNADDSILDYEEKYGRPFREGYIQSLRDDYYDNIAYDDYKAEDDTNAKNNNNDSEEFDDESDKTEQNNDEIVETDKAKNGDADMNKIDAIDPLVRLEAVSTTISGDEDVSKKDDVFEKEVSTTNDYVTKTTAGIIPDNFETINNNNNMENTNDEEVEQVVKDEEPDIFSSKGDDNEYAAEDEEAYDEEGTSQELFGEEDKKDPQQVKKTTASPETTTTEKSSETTKTMQVSDLNPEQYDQLMEQFKILHSEEFDSKAEKVDRNVAPTRINLEVYEPVSVTSDRYPANYPTNNVNDWIFDGHGKGMGIELNVTDFAVNGALGDYVLFKPGGEDDSGQDGLVFSYTLNSPRAYRFLDVDRMFVRFVANQGMQFRRGFNFTVMLISELPEDDYDIDLPEPEALLPTPKETHTLYLGTVNRTDFLQRKEEFRQIIADMALMYINNNGIDRGLNTTFEITQITHVAVCNINWPDYNTCTEVTVGVPLVYEEGSSADPRLTEEDLKKMWDDYRTIDPFALRLRRMGVSEYSVPDDGSVLTVWAVIAFGVLVAMAMLAVALWRFSCFENYTRMPQFSDQDSMYSEKQGLDLYPTPHQTLPPLYESQYKWEDSNRADMGGFTNKTFNRDELYDIESDEDVIGVRDKDRTIQPKHIYDV